MSNFKLLSTAIVIFALFGCASTKSGSSASSGESGKSPQAATASKSTPPSTSGVRKVKSKDGTFEGEMVGMPAPKAKFAKLQIGMRLRQVEELIGAPNDTDTHMTGKVFIPFFFGGDTHRTEAYYKNEGQLTYSPDHMGDLPSVLIRIAFDPKATGSR